MKILLSESQIKKILLNERILKVSTIYVDEYIHVQTYNENIIIPYGEEENITIFVRNKMKKPLVIYTLTDDDWGYRGEGDITYEQKPAFTGQNAKIEFTLKGKQSQGSNNTTSFDLAYFTPNGEKRTRIRLHWSSKSFQEGMNYCKGIYTDEALNNAKKYWLNWLQNPKTMEKYMKNWEMGVGEATRIFQDYINAINRTSMKFYVNNHDRALAYVQKRKFNTSFNTTIFMPIYVNCSSAPLRVNNNSKMASETLVHEMQHLLDVIHPWDPNKSETAAKINKTVSKVSNKLSKFGFKKTDSKVIINRMVDDGFNQTTASPIVMDYLNRMKDDNESDYIADKNELSSRIFDMRKFLNIQPGQDITKQQIITHTHTTPGYYLILGYLMSGLTLDQFLVLVNSHAKTTSPIDITGTSNLI